MKEIYGLYADIRVLEQERLFQHFFYELSEQRQQKIEALQLMRSKYQSLGAWTLLDQLLKKHEGLRERELRIATGIKKKPYVLDRNDLHFNLSHSKDYAFAVISPVAVGCDIQYEEQNGREERLAERFFSKEEQAAFADGMSFYRIWASKESWIKCDGSGMTQDLRSFSVVGGALDSQSAGRQLVKLRKDDYEMAVCYMGAGVYPVRLEEIDLKHPGGD